MTASTIQPAEILRELDDLWVSLGKEHGGEGTGGVLRACAMSLIVVEDGGAGQPPVGETLAALMKDHPSRAIAVRLQAGLERSLDARVTAQCWMPFGRQQQICCEQIEIDATVAGAADLPPVIRGLTVPDLPVVVWCRSLPLLWAPELEPMFALADKVIVNSSGCGDAERLFARFRELGRSGPVVADLSWTRLTRWRETIAQVFENEARRKMLPEVRTVMVVHFGEHVPVRAMYLQSWLRTALGKGPEYRLESAPELEPCQPQGEVQAVAIDGPDLSVSIAQAGGEAVDLRAGDLSKRTVFPVLNEYQLLSEELSIEGRDAVFDAVFASVAG